MAPPIISAKQVEAVLLADELLEDQSQDEGEKEEEEQEDGQYQPEEGPRVIDLRSIKPISCPLIPTASQAHRGYKLSLPSRRTRTGPSPSSSGKPATSTRRSTEPQAIVFDSMPDNFERMSAGSSSSSSSDVSNRVVVVADPVSGRHYDPSSYRSASLLIPASPLLNAEAWRTATRTPVGSMVPATAAANAAAPGCPVASRIAAEMRRRAMSSGERMGAGLARAVAPRPTQAAPRTPMEWLGRWMLTGLAAGLRWIFSPNVQDSATSRQPSGPTGPELIVSQLSLQSRQLLVQLLELPANSTAGDIARAASKPSPDGFTKFGGFLHAFELCTKDNNEPLSIFLLDQLFGICNQYQYRDCVRWNVLLKDWNYDIGKHATLCPKNGKALFRFQDAATMFGIRWKLENHGFDLPFQNIYEPHDLLFQGAPPPEPPSTRERIHDQDDDNEQDDTDEDAPLNDPEDDDDAADDNHLSDSQDSSTADTLPLGGMDLIALEFPLKEWAMAGKIKAEHLLAMCARSSIERGITLEALVSCGLDKEAAHKMGLTAWDASAMNWQPGTYDALELPQKNPGKRNLYFNSSGTRPLPSSRADPAPSPGRVDVM